MRCSRLLVLRLSGTGAPVDAVVCPWFTVLDMAVPLLVQQARAVACIHVPGSYLSSGVSARYRYLRRLQEEGRLVVLFGAPRSVMGWRCAWLLVFKSAAVKRSLLLPEWQHMDGVAMQ